MKRLLALFSVLCLLSSVAFAAVHPKGAEPLRIAHGEKINLADYLVPGKTVVFDFTSKYCGPCQTYEAPLHALHAKRSDLIVVKVDVNRPGVEGIDWASPVALQFDLHSLPSFKVYSPAGKLVVEDKIVFGPDGRPNRAASSNAGRKMVDAWIEAAN